MEGWFLGLMAVSDQARDQVDKSVHRAAVASVLNLRNVLELINDTFNNSPFSKKEFIDHFCFSRDSPYIHERKYFLEYSKDIQKNILRNLKQNGVRIAI